MSSSLEGRVDELITLGGFVDITNVMTMLVKDEEARDTFGNPMYAIIFLPPKMKLKLLRRNGSHLFFEVTGSDLELGEEDMERLHTKLMNRECISSIYDLEKAL